MEIPSKLKMVKMVNRLDIIVFAASGFVGKHTLPYLYNLVKSGEKYLTWGVAGRSKENLEGALAETAQRVGIKDLNDIPIIIANIENEESLRNMTAQAKVILNCCGPYQLYAEVVVKACIDTGTHHLDVTPEPTFMESIELKYSKAAQEKDVYIVSACGFASISTDMGIIFLEKQFKGTLNSVEAYLGHHIEGGLSNEPQVHYGTWASAVDAAATYRNINSLRRRLYPDPLPPVQPKLSLKLVHKNDETKKWAIPLLGPLDDVVNRSQRYFYESSKKRPVQIQSYLLIDSFLYVMLTSFFALAFLILSQFTCGRNLLLKYPERFSKGFFSHKDPTEETLDRQLFSITFCGKGWNETQSENKEEFNTPPNKKIVGRMMSCNPGYGFTCLSFVLCGIMIVTQPAKLPPKGGVYTTATAFYRTSLLEELQKNGVVFEIVSSSAD